MSGVMCSDRAFAAIAGEIVGSGSEAAAVSTANANGDGGMLGIGCAVDQPGIA